MTYRFRTSALATHRRGTGRSRSLCCLPFFAVAQPAGRYRTEWIIPPKSPGAGVLEALRDCLQRRPGIEEAWLVGNQIVPLDGGASWDASLIGLVLGSSADCGKDHVLALYDDLVEATGWGQASDEGWQLLSPDEVSEHADTIVRVYSRGTNFG